VYDQRMKMTKHSETKNLKLVLVIENKISIIQFITVINLI
jgi:hypothetical protein